MKYGEFSEREVGIIREDAREAIDALKAIIAECNSEYVSRRYLQEKVEKAKWCVTYIRDMVQE